MSPQRKRIMDRIDLITPASVNLQYSKGHRNSLLGEISQLRHILRSVAV